MPQIGDFTMRKKNKRRKSTVNNSNIVECNEPIRYTKNNRIRYEQNVPQQYASSLMPVNAFEQKSRFLNRKLTPEFHLNAIPGDIESLLLHSSGNIKFTLFREATRILETVCRKFKNLDNFIEQSFGPRITVEEATAKITEFIEQSNLPTGIDVIWCDDLIGSALMCSTGIDKNGNIPRMRKFTMLLKTNEENTYLREKGILCLMDHEIGTHYHRSFNEGLQPWYGKREIYGLGSTNSCESVEIEEGLACLHTIIRAEHKYLGIPALLYYGSCMAEYLPFKDLFEHLGKFVKNEEQRWKHCMRIKRCLPSQDRCGGYGKDQRYFEGAVKILRQQANLDFQLLMAGKLTLEETEKIRRSVILSAIKLPSFMQDRDKYLSTLRRIARLNGISILKPKMKNSRSESDQINIGIKSLPKIRKTNQPKPNREPSPVPKLIRPDQNISPKNNVTQDEKCPIDNLLLPELPRPQTDPGLFDKICSPTSFHSVPGTVTITGGDQMQNAKYDIQSIPALSASSPARSDSTSSRTPEALIRKKLMHTLAMFTNPASRTISNARVYLSTIDPTNNTKFKRRKSWSKTHQSEEEMFQNFLKSLPNGVCGCQLFTHGTLCQIKRQNSQPSKLEHKKSLESDSQKNTDDPPGIRSIHIPMILEIDLRHPIIGINQR